MYETDDIKDLSSFLKHSPDLLILGWCDEMVHAISPKVESSRNDSIVMQMDVKITK